MCFTVLLSTDCPDDLFAQNGNGICFRPADDQGVRAAAMPMPTTTTWWTTVQMTATAVAVAVFPFMATARLPNTVFASRK